MADFINVGTEKATFLTADAENQIRITNASNTTLYYKTTSDVSSSSNDGNLTQGQSAAFSAPQYVIPSARTQVVIEYLAGEEIVDQLRLVSGTAAANKGIIQNDVNLYRSAANVWTTDDGLTVTGATTVTGGIVPATSQTVHWAVGGSTVLATSGTDSAMTNGDRYWTALFLPHDATLTGIFYIVGSIGGTDKVVAELKSSTGASLANSALAGATVGTAAQIQAVAFTATYAANGPALYYIVTQFNGTTAKFRTYPIPGSQFVAGTAAGTFGTLAAITPGTTFTADKGPIGGVY